MIRRFPAIARVEPPGRSLLATEAARPGAYDDAFRVEIATDVDLQGYLAAFLTTPVFAAERRLLGLAGFPSGPPDVAALAGGASDRFAVWQVAARRGSELLLRDVTGRTRSWFHVQTTDAGTRLWFGSAILPAGDASRLGAASRLTLGPHRAYSRLLLASAASRLSRA
jgi:hypothetical protein